jgi:hypothetical protein
MWTDLRARELVESAYVPIRCLGELDPQLEGRLCARNRRRQYSSDLLSLKIEQT